MVASANVADRNETPRGKRTCGYCVYGLPGLGEAPEKRVCINRLERPGQLCPVQANGTCQQFRPRPRRPVRVAPPAPPSDEVRYIALTQGKFAIVDAAD